MTRDRKCTCTDPTSEKGCAFAGSGIGGHSGDPEPLTRERAREWLTSDIERIDAMDVYRDGDEARAALYSLIDEHGDGREWAGLQSLLVDAAAGRVR